MASGVRERVREIVANICGVLPEKVGDSQPFDDVCAGFDQIDRLEVLMGVEEEFGVAIEDEDGDKMATVSHVVEHLKTLGITDEEE